MAAGVEDDIAFIRRTVEEGRTYARGRSPDLLVWGLCIAAGYLGTYAYVRHWSPVEPRCIWVLFVVPPWIYSLRHVAARLLRYDGAKRQRTPMAQALSMLWLGCGIFLTTLAVVAQWNGPASGLGWFDAVAAGVLGIGFFGSSYLCNLAWMRWVAIGWWISEIVLYGLRDHATTLLVDAGLMLFLFAGPGLVLLLSRRGVKAA